MSETIKDWVSETDNQGILWLTLDMQDSATNLLSTSILEQLDTLLDQISADRPSAVIIQ